MTINHPKRKGVPSRPHWNYTNEGYDAAISSLEMLESVRNVLEAIHGSQMLQCDVAWAIKKMSAAIIRIDKRLQKVEGMKLR